MTGEGGVGGLGLKQDSWCYIINNSDRLTSEECQIISGKGGDMKQAVNRWQKLSKSESLQMIAEAKEKQRRDRAAEIHDAIDEGMEKGREEGREKNTKETALRMIRAGFKLEDICKATELSEDKILELKKSD